MAGFVDTVNAAPAQGRAPTLEPVRLPDADLFRTPPAIPRGPTVTAPAPQLSGIGRMLQPAVDAALDEAAPLPAPPPPVEFETFGHRAGQLQRPTSAGGQSAFERGARIGIEGLVTAAGESMRMVAQPGEEFGHRAGRLQAGGLPAVEQAGRDIAAAARERQAAIPGSRKSFSEIDNLEEALDWAAVQIGQGLVSTVPSIVGGAAGFAVGGPTGAVAGAMAPGYLQNQNEVREALRAEGLDEAEADRISMIAAAPMAALDALMPARLGSKLTGPARAAAVRTVLQRARAIAAAGGQNLLLEGATEGAQEAINISTQAAATGRPIGRELVSRAPEIVEAGAGGGLTGLVLGGAGQVVEEARRPSIAPAPGRGSTILPGPSPRPAAPVAPLEAPAQPAPPSDVPGPTGQTDPISLTELLGPEPATEPTSAPTGPEADPLAGPDGITRRSAIAPLGVRPERPLPREELPTLLRPESPEGSVVDPVTGAVFPPGTPVDEATGRPLSPEAAAELAELEPHLRPPPAPDPKPGNVVRMRTSDIIRDPQRFQFKQLGDEGVSGELKDVPFNPTLAGVVSVWRDPADQRVYVINGHHRHELAQRRGAPELNVQFLDAPTAEIARAEGAFINIAEGRGTATDVAKFLRDTGGTTADFEARGVSLRGNIAREGMALSRLAPDVFEQVATQKVPQTWGIAIGELLEDPVLQREALTAARGSGKRLTQMEVREIARQVRDAGVEAITQENLFGTETERHGLFVQRGQLAVAIKKRLSGDRRLFGFVAREGRADQLARAGETKIDVGAARGLAESSSQVEELFDRLYTRSGPIADLVSEGARRIARGEKPGAVVAELYPAIGEAVRRELAEGTRPDGQERPVAQGERPPADGTGSPERAEGTEPPPFVDPEQEPLFDAPSRGRGGAVPRPKTPQVEAPAGSTPLGMRPSPGQPPAAVPEIDVPDDVDIMVEAVQRLAQIEGYEGQDGDDLERSLGRRGALEIERMRARADADRKLLLSIRGDRASIEAQYGPEVADYVADNQPVAAQAPARGGPPVTPAAGPREYVSESHPHRPATPEDVRVRDVARRLKNADPDAIAEAAREMLPRIPAGAQLIPLPNSKGDFTANEALADTIAELGDATQQEIEVRTGMGRRPGTFESSRARRQSGRPGATAEEQAASLTAADYSLVPLGEKIVFIDNVEVSGATAEGARRVLGRPDAVLVTYARAPRPAFEAKATVPSAGALKLDDLLGPATPVEREIERAGDAGRAIQVARLRKLLEREDLPANERTAVERELAKVAPEGDRPALQLQSEPEGPDQGSLLTSREGTADTRSLKQTEAAARSELEVLRERFKREKDPERRAALASQIADREKLVNRGQAISAEELTARAAAEPTTATDLPEQMALLSVPVMGERGPVEQKLAVVPKGETVLRPIAPVELVRLAMELLGGNRVFMRRYPSARGAFYPDPRNPRIGLNPELGKDYDQFVKTLAHEVGHLIDFLPDSSMNKGNILGRIAVLRDYLAETIDREPTVPSRALTADDRRKIRAAAEKTVGKRPPKDQVDALRAWQLAVGTEYAERIKEEMELRNLIGRERIHEELLLLSTWWRPFDPDVVPLAYRAYRESSKELYADAVSVLLNSPGTLQERAPTFFDAFLAYLERKPAVKQAYEDVQDLIGQGDDAIYRARQDELEQDFELGEDLRRIAEQRVEKQSWSNYFNQLFGTRAAPLTKAERKRVGKRAAHSEDYAIKHAYQEFLHGDNVNRLLMMDVVQDVVKPMEDLQISQEQAGTYLMMARIAEGDRGGMAEEAKDEIRRITGEMDWETAKAAYIQFGQDTADDPDSEFDPDLLRIAETGLLNPHGYTPAEAKKQMAGLRKELGDKAFERLEELMGRFRDILAAVPREAARLGVYSRKVYRDKVMPNEATYVPFAVLDYFNGRVPAGLRKQVGTVKGVANPFTAAVLKAMALNRMNEIQRFKLVILRTIDADFKDVGPERSIDRYHRESRPAKGRDNLMYFVDGKLVYREVDDYITKVLEQSDLGFVQRFGQMLSSWTYRIFHPLYVMWSIGWQTRNLPRDFKRTYKNLSSQHAGKPTYRQALNALTDIPKLLTAYGKTLGSAYRHARRRPDAMIREMLQDKALGRAFLSFEPFEGSSTVERLAQQYGLMKPPPPGAVKATAQKAMRIVEAAGVMQETWTKAAAYRLLTDAGLTGKQRSYIVRNYMGTPDSSDRGLASDAVNGFYLYANVIVAGWRADMSIATNPKTASGYWLRATLIDFMPKMLMLAAALGWLGDEYEEWMRHIPEYEKEKFIIVPLPPFYSETPDGKKKAVYRRIPHDDTNRVMAAIAWVLGNGADRPHAPSRAVSIVSGEFPGINPAIDLTAKWVEFMGNRNPYDAFRGRDIVPRTEWEAGGWPRTREMLKYSMGEFGVASNLVDWLGGFAGYTIRPEPGEQAAGEQAVRSVPVVSALVRMSNRGLTEERWWELEWEAQARARLRSDLSDEVRKATSDRSRLNRLGDERLTDEEEARRRELNTWYQASYLPLLAEAETHRDNDNTPGYQDAIRRLDESIGQPIVPRGRRPGPRPPRPRR